MEVTLVAERKFKISQVRKNCPAIKVEIQNGKTIFLTDETKIVKVDDNTVVAYYNGWKETITAEGSGNTRYNFKRTIEEAAT